VCVIKVPKNGALEHDGKKQSEHKATGGDADDTDKATGEDADDTALRIARLKTEMRDLGREYEREQEEPAELSGAGSLFGARSRQEHTTQVHGVVYGREIRE
jgi:hypothetical protein